MSATQYIHHNDVFAAAREVATLHALLDSADGYAERDDWCQERDNQLVIYDKHLRNANHDHVRTLDDVVERIVATIRDTYQADVEAETVIMAKMRPGSQHTPHADAELPDGSPNHTPNRTHVGLLYLQAPDAGGVLRVWDVEAPPDDSPVAEFTADPGRLVCFPSTRHFYHDVTPVEAGERYNLSVWTRARLD